MILMVMKCKFLMILIFGVGIPSCWSVKPGVTREDYISLYNKELEFEKAVISKIDNIDTILCGLFGDSATIEFDSNSFYYLPEIKRDNIKACYNRHHQLEIGL
jgi:hypothetical protein